MALKDCPECSGQVSTDADRCPHCGYPVNPEKSDVYQFRLRILKNLKVFLCICGVVCIFLLFFRDTRIAGLYSGFMSLLGLIVISLKINMLE